jgi:hypothetical protein
MFESHPRKVWQNVSNEAVIEEQFFKIPPIFRSSIKGCSCEDIRFLGCINIGGNPKKYRIYELFISRLGHAVA